MDQKVGKINEVDKPPLRLTKKKKKNSNANIKSEKGNITTNQTDIKRLVIEYYEKLYVYKFNNWDERAIFLKCIFKNP